MDDETAFIELSALLTGLYDQLVNDQEDRALNGPIAREYARRLLGTFPELLNAYKSLAEADPKPPIDDNLLADLRKTEAFKNNEFVAKQIVNIWYFSQFTAVENDHMPHTWTAASSREVTSGRSSRRSRSGFPISRTATGRRSRDLLTRPKPGGPYV